MQPLNVSGIGDWLLDLFSWKEKRSGIIRPDERLPWPDTGAMGLQHVLAMFGSTVLAPILMGMDPNVAIFFSGVGTLLFFLVTGGRIPSYLGSSFAFIGPVLAITGGVVGSDQIPRALGGIVICGLVYTLIGFVVSFTGSDWIDALMPPIVTGGVVAIIGLNLADEAMSMANDNMGLAIVTILAIFAVAILGKGLIGRLPILLGTIIGYLFALLAGGTSGDGRDILNWHVSGVNFDGVRAASWFGMPNFQTPSFDGKAVSLIAPVAVVLIAENTGHIKAVSEMTQRNLMPWLGRGFVGDGIATIVSGFGGGTGVTTYAENIGVMAVTRVYSTAIFIVASGVALFLGFSPKFGALIASIPLGVLGGVSAVLFGLIATAGIRIWVDNRVDFSKGLNLFLAAVTLIVGTGNFTLVLGDFEMNGIALGTFGSIILYQIFRHAAGAADEDPGATPASAGEPNPASFDVVAPTEPVRSSRRERAEPATRRRPARSRRRDAIEQPARGGQRFVDQPMVDAYDDVDPYDMDDPGVVARSRRAGEQESRRTPRDISTMEEIPGGSMSSVLEELPPMPEPPTIGAPRATPRPSRDQFDDDFGYVDDEIDPTDRRA